jgi:hypothetical protein
MVPHTPAHGESVALPNPRDIWLLPEDLLKISTPEGAASSDE